MVSTSVRKLIGKTTDGPHSVNDTMLVVSKEHKQVKTKHKIQKMKLEELEAVGLVRRHKS